MRFPVFSERDRRALLFGVAAVAIVLLFVRGLPAWRRWEADTRASLVQVTGHLGRARAEISTARATEDSLEARSARLVALAPRIVGSGSRAAAGASLAALVSGAAAQAHVELGTVEVRPDSVSTGAFSLIRVRADASGDLPGLLRMLQALETGPELLSVPDWSITQSAPGGPAEQPETLRLEFTVEGIAATDTATVRAVP